MAYVEQSDLKGLMPEELTVESLDDNRDGLPDPSAWAEVVKTVGEEIEAALERGGFPVPCPEPMPKVVKRAARILAVNECYLRRGVKDHPRVDEVKTVRAELAKIKAGDPLKAGRTAGSGTSAITEPSVTHLAGGGLLS